VELEITRYVLGNVGEADNEGKAEMVNVLEDPSFLPTGGAGGTRNWWHGYRWPDWWHQHNGVGKVSWKVKLPAGKDTAMNYDWHYFWR